MIQIIQWLLEGTAGLTPEVKARFEDEGLCRRCGRCCYGAIRVKSRLVLLKDLPCKHLVHDRAGLAVCRIYPLRERTGYCHKVGPASIRKELFPPDCPYVAGLKGYGGKIEIPDADFDEIIPIIRNLLALIDQPDFVSPRRWQAFLRDRLGREA